MESWVVSKPYYLEVIVTDSSGQPVNDLIITYSIIQLPDTVIQSGTLLGIDGGIYQAIAIFTSTGQYRILYDCPEGYPNSIEHIKVIAADSSWDELLGDHKSTGTFGKFVQKLLTISKFLGLK